MVDFSELPTQIAHLFHKVSELCENEWWPHRIVVGFYFEDSLLLVLCILALETLILWDRSPSKSIW
jgi:hypothetical protein